MQTLSIIMPVYNEAGTVKKVIEAIERSAPSFRKQIIIVDDFSTDGTRDILKNIKQEDLKVFFNAKNQGKGACVRKGLLEATGDFVLIQDADLEYNPAEYEKLIAPLSSGEVSVVYGSRFLGRKPALKTYYLANRFLTFLSNRLSGLSLTDMETCYKCFTREAAGQIAPRLCADRFDIEPEITAIVARLNLEIKEVPIDYLRRSYAAGKKIGWRDGLQAIVAIVRFNLFK